MIKDSINFRSDNGEIVFSMSRVKANAKIKLITKWRTTKGERDYVSRLFSCGTAEFNKILKSLKQYA